MTLRRKRVGGRDGHQASLVNDGWSVSWYCYTHVKATVTM